MDTSVQNMTSNDTTGTDDEQCLGWCELVMESTYYLNGPGTALVVAIGLLLNMASVAMFMRPSRQRRPCIYYYLITLALWDSVLLTNAFAMYSLPTCLFGQLVYHDNAYVYVYPVVYTLSNVTLIGSVWIVMTLTFDRYFALCQPLTHKTIGKKSRVKRLLMTVSVLAAIFGLPRCFELSVVMVTAAENRSVPMVQPSELYQNTAYTIVYRVIGGLMFYSLVPFIVLLAITVRITFAIRTAGRKRRTMSVTSSRPGCNSTKPSVVVRLNANGSASAANEAGCSTTAATAHGRQPRKKPSMLGGGGGGSSGGGGEHSINVMLLAVIVKFLVTHLMPSVLDVLELTVGYEAFNHYRYMTSLVLVSNFLVVLNSASNFWIYLLWGSNFRSNIVECVRAQLNACVACCGWRRAPPDDMVVAACAGDANSVNEMRMRHTSFGASLYNPRMAVVHQPAITSTAAATDGFSGHKDSTAILKSVLVTAASPRDSGRAVSLRKQRWSPDGPSFAPPTSPAMTPTTMAAVSANAAGGSSPHWMSNGGGPSRLSPGDLTTITSTSFEGPQGTTQASRTSPNGSTIAIATTNSASMKVLLASCEPSCNSSADEISSVSPTMAHPHPRILQLNTAQVHRYDGGSAVHTAGVQQISSPLSPRALSSVAFLDDSVADDSMLFVTVASSPGTDVLSPETDVDVFSDA